MNARRSAAALAATAVLTMAAAPLAAADDAPSPAASASLPSGLYGKADPKFDGVFRQSYALLAQTSEGFEPAAKAVDWLTGQQCSSGGFAAFRADPSEPCDAKTPVDSNSTASAVQALATLGGQDKTVDKAVAWLKSVQNQDGGWGYNPGLPSDANSTGIVVGALSAAGEKPASFTSQKGKSPYDALPSLTIPCDKDGGGAFGLQDMKSKKLVANADATAAGVTGSLGKGLVVEAGEKRSLTACNKATDVKQAAANGSSYLAKTLRKDGHLTSSMPGSKDQPDVGNTADAVVALAAAGLTEQAEKPYTWLEKNGPAWAKGAGPAAYAQLVFAAHATGGNPRDFGGTDLVAALNATGPKPEKASVAGRSEDEKDDDGMSISVWWIVGVGLVAGAGIGFLFSGRNK
ncbi:Prenyltransferase and squalene oxidase repeat protein [Streptomyces sp. YIM 130001]|uniref:prenyltransferase/squalene oxidase repeat-containing protein n=1 Tax=Streptomyces sp. YIM 130001 TaxID=2259644 RepID=UPI000E65C92F|nr:prenyltransferase/squalene oxidase repeat-containing protein [Streptomyces sp. YIM 130001]RII16986.1 Prenyltransferase and squalene oxidase repeat protein [Streptomyces sp. YIM 130001]